MVRKFFSKFVLCIYSNKLVNGLPVLKCTTPSEMDFVYVKEPHVGRRTKISGINLSEIYNERLKKIVENDLDVSSHQFG